MMAFRVVLALSPLLTAAAPSERLLAGVSGLNDTVQKKCSSYPHGHSMECGEGVRLCGVLTLETGDGSGFYHSSVPAVHGLWPETSSFGNSECVKPQNATDPQKIYECYKPDGTVSAAHQLSFEQHEWEKHGRCAGVSNAESFFSQVCSLAAGPLKVMQAAKSAGLDLSATADQLQRSGYCVYQTMTQFQIELSACAGQNGQWKLADVADFPSVCKWDGPPPPSPSPKPSPEPSPKPSPSAGSCVPGKRGPSCAADADCAGLSDCVRCAHSGFCTAQPLALQPIV